MKIRGLLVATVVFAVLAGVLYWSDHRKASAEAAKPDADAAPSILKLDENSITQLALKRKDSTPIRLTKTGSDWKITEPKLLGADQTAVTGVLSTLSALNPSAWWRARVRVSSAMVSIIPRSSWTSRKKTSGRSSCCSETTHPQEGQYTRPWPGIHGFLPSPDTRKRALIRA